MFPNMQAYMKAKYGKLKEVEITRDQLIELYMQHGKTREDAEFQTNIGFKMGADSVVMGDIRYILKEEAPDGAQDHTS